MSILHERGLRGTDSFVLRNDTYENRCLNPNVFSSIVDKTFIIMTKNTVVVILKMSHFFSLLFLIPLRLVPSEAGSYNSVQSLAMIFWTAGIITKGGGYNTPCN